TVDQSGRVIAVSKGSATIKATANDGSGKYASCSVTVNRLVTSIDFDMPSIVLYNGERATITATVLPETATNRNLRWTSSNTSVATVSSSGVVTGVARGTAMITATAQDGSGISKSCQVEVKQYVTGITMNKTSITLNEGQTMMLTPTISPSNANDKSVTWSAGNTSVAIVDQYGFVTGVSKGITTIVATANDGSRKSAACSVTVNRLVSSIDLDKTSILFFNGENTTITAIVLPETATNRNLNWSSSNTSVATVSSSGVVTGVARGTATITAAAQDSSRISKTCQVEVKQYVTAISLSEISLSLNEGQSSTLSVSSITPDNANDKSVNWSSSNTSVATVSQNGEVVGVSKGAATITATANDGSGKSASCSVTIKRLVSSVEFNKTEITLYNGKDETLTATVSPPTANEIGLIWSSSNSTIATVDQSGKITGVERGTATITAMAVDGSGKSASCQVEVKQYVTGITLENSSLALNEGQTMTLTPTISPSNANDKSVSWSSDNTSVAIVDQNGNVTAVARGTAILKATAKDGSGKIASCLVRVYSNPINLSAGGSANCYIVSSSSDYSFRTTKGNSSESAGVVSSAVVLWESYGTSTVPSVGSVINNVIYSNDAIYFSTPSTLKNGNAIIAAKDASGNILWSWHIWVCKDFAPVATVQVYYNNAGTMMDRNLGATSATPGDVGALGLLYQWGRKDPFMGSSSISSNYKAASTLSWPSPVTSGSSNGTIDYATSHPTTFVCGTANTEYDWVYSSRDNTLWQSNKTIYDPCPPGWRVPDGGSGGVWSKAVNSSSGFSYNWDSTNWGINFSGKFGNSSTIWYSLTGLLSDDNGGLYSAHAYGFWWSCTPNDSIAYYLSLDRYGRVLPSDTTSGRRANGYSVRCQKE
ncbi:MAG: Ig-like domain-containing protein, partial [Bacteroidales bacterium]|nr:Ig-like domain-containing protein [Bacteroidales bacterium]